MFFRPDSSAPSIVHKPTRIFVTNSVIKFDQIPLCRTWGYVSNEPHCKLLFSISCLAFNKPGLQATFKSHGFPSSFAILVIPSIVPSTFGAMKYVEFRLAVHNIRLSSTFQSTTWTTFEPIPIFPFEYVKITFITIVWRTSATAIIFKTKDKIPSRYFEFSLSNRDLSSAHSTRFEFQIGIVHHWEFSSILKSESERA